MARGELMKRLLASYGRDDEFRAVAEQIISEEEQKNNRVLARSLRQTLEHAQGSAKIAKGLAPLIPFPDAANEYIERVNPVHSKRDVLLSPANTNVFVRLIEEFRRSDDIRRHGLPVTSKLLFCGKPGTGKTVSAQAFAAELALPLFSVKLDRLISSYLGETASNIRKIFEFARKQPCVLLLDEFDALARSREDSSEHSELRRVVNSLLMFIESLTPRGFLVAATNLDASLDLAIWRRFDEVVWFEYPNESMVRRFLKLKFRNMEAAFDPTAFAPQLQGYSYAEIERVAIQAMKLAVIARRRIVAEEDFILAIAEEARRKNGHERK